MREKLTYFQKRCLSKSLRARMSRSKHTQTAAAKKAGVDQPAISRALRGEFDELTPKLEKILLYAGFASIKLLVDLQPPLSEKLKQSLQRVWDGTPRGERALRKALVMLDQLAGWKSPDL